MLRCNRTFENKGALTTHLKSKHGQDGASEQRTDDDMYTCPECDNAFNSKGGLNVHRRVNHPDVYHAARQPAARVKARWSHEELVLLALAELEIRRTNPPQGVLRVLHSRFPDRTFEAMKSLRNNNLRYKEVLALEAEKSASQPAAEVPFERSHSSTDVDGLSRDRSRDDIRHLGVDDLDSLIDGCPDQDICDKLDELFTSWVRHLVHGERSSSGNPRPASNDENPNHELDPRRRTHAQYSALQHVYGHKPSACAHKVLDGTWENTEHSTAPSLEHFWKTWQPIFETPSIKDNRRPTCVGQVKWEIVAPVTPTEVQEVLSEGVSSAPGPDGAKLKDVNGLGMDELCSHFNL